MKPAFALALALHGAPDEHDVAAPVTSEVEHGGEGIDTGQLGIGLAAVGAALATGTATGVVLLEALTRPDDRDDEIANPEIVQVTGFATIALGSVSAILVLAGGALIVDDALKSE